MFLSSSKRCINLLLAALALSTTQSYAQPEFLRLIDDMSNANLDTSSRIEALSSSLIGIPYADGNLGEGEQGRYDKDPLFRLDVFDCTTYVETVLAGALSERATDFPQHMQQIRYHNGDISFVTRNHFISADWIPNNQWLLKDITATVGQGYELLARTVIDKKAWYQAMTDSRIQGQIDAADKPALLNQLHKEGQRFAPEPVQTPYIPLSALFVMHSSSSESIAKRQQAALAILSDPSLDENGRNKAWHQLAIQYRLEDSHINQALLDRIPSGSVISMIRPDYDVKRWIGTNLNVTHQSIAIRKNDRLYLRHASQLKKAVVDEEFTTYFSKYLLNSSLKGFNIQQPTF